MSKHKFNLYLDLDQTLISAEPTEEINVKKHGKKMKLFKYHDMDGYYIVFERPNLQEFLDYAFSNFNVSVWTAASKDYALFIIDNIILQNRPERKLNYIFFSYHCDLSRKHKDGSKDLTMLWDVHNIEGHSEGNTIILDDYVEDVHDTQPHRCLIAVPFEFTKKGSENDDFLIKLIPELKNMNEKASEKDEIILASDINKSMRTV